MWDLDRMVKLQNDEIKKLNIEIITLKTRNENLIRRRSCCSIDTENRSKFSMKESETYLMTKLRKNSMSNFSNESFMLDQESNIGGDVIEETWPFNEYKFEIKLRGNLLNFIFKKTAKYIDTVKFHRVLIFCSKEYNRKISEIELKFHPSPGNIYLY